MNHNKAFLILTFVLTLIFQACSSNAINISTPINTMVMTPTATTPVETLQINPVRFGSDVNIDHMNFVVTGTIRPANGIVAAGSMFNAQPQAYHQYFFVTLDVTCELTADQQCHLNIFKIKLLGRDDVLKYPKWYLSGVDGILKNTDFQGGTTISGHAPFIVSIGDSGLLLIYESLSGDSFYFALP